jgi:hypothetical protein
MFDIVDRGCEDFLVDGRDPPFELLRVKAR